MQEDFHYYAVYYLSLCAGIEPDIAYKIAYSSQYVDYFSIRKNLWSDRVMKIDINGKSLL